MCLIQYDEAVQKMLMIQQIAALHLGITSTSFIAASGFQLSAAILTLASDVSQVSLSTIDALYGATESSRALNSVVRWIRREYRDRIIGAKGVRVEISDMLVGALGFALLQQWGWKRTQREMARKKVEAVIWDVVIMDDGSRADVVGSQRLDYGVRKEEISDISRPASFADANGRAADIEAIERRDPARLSGSWFEQPVSEPCGMSNEELKDYVLRQLPLGSTVKVSFETLTAKTVTVDITGPEAPLEINAPPGTRLIENEVTPFDFQASSGSGPSPPGHEDTFRHTFVFQSSLSKTRSTDFSHESMPEDLLFPTTEEPDDLARTGDGLELKEVDRRLSSLMLKQSASSPQLTVAGQSIVPAENEEVSPYMETSIRPILGFSNSSSNTTDQDLSTANSTPTASIAKPSDRSSNPFLRSSLARIATKVKASQSDSAERNSDAKEKRKKSLSDFSGRNTKSKTFPTTYDTNSTPEKRSGDGEMPEAIQPGVSGRAKSQGAVAKTKQHVNKRPRIAEPTIGAPQDEEESQGRPSSRRRSRTSCLPLTESKRNSFISQVDSYSVHSTTSRSGSPVTIRSRTRTRSSFDLNSRGNSTVRMVTPGPGLLQRTMNPHSRAASETSLVLSIHPNGLARSDQGIIDSLQRNGIMPGAFPHDHFVKNVRKYGRFSSAAYGKGFLRLVGLVPPESSLDRSDPKDCIHSSEHLSFSRFTGLDPSSILLSSFVDPNGGSNIAGETSTGIPLVHYVSLDHESKAVVLTCRGTLGFEDVLIDAMADYDDLYFRGKPYKVHKGMHASARRLLNGGGGRVMATIKAALEEFPDYGFVLCGHSLGGSVVALLAIMLAQPALNGSSESTFVTSSQPDNGPYLLTSSENVDVDPSAPPLSLPSGRPIHVYAYGPTGVVCPALREQTRGLITSIVNGTDVVPSLSIGNCHDIQQVALAFKTDTTGAKSRLRARIWDGLLATLRNSLHTDITPSIPTFDDLDNDNDMSDEDSWAWAALKTLRAEMQSLKLYPAGEVFIVETSRVLQRDAFSSQASPDIAGGYPRLGKPATRVQVKYVNDVEARYGEIRFQAGMFTNHYTQKYEATLRALGRGIVGDYRD